MFHKIREISLSKVVRETWIAKISSLFRPPGVNWLSIAKRDKESKSPHVRRSTHQRYEWCPHSIIIVVHLTPRAWRCRESRAYKRARKGTLGYRAIRWLSRLQGNQRAWGSLKIRSATSRFIRPLRMSTPLEILPPTKMPMKTLASSQETSTSCNPTSKRSSSGKT